MSWLELLWAANPMHRVRRDCITMTIAYSTFLTKVERDRREKDVSLTGCVVTSAEAS